MATVYWEPKAAAVAQVDTLQVTGTWLAAETITLTINSKAVVITIGSLVTVSQVATTIQEAWENSTFTDTTAAVTPEDGGQGITEHSEITATVASDTVTLTGPAGIPFTLSVAESSASGGITHTAGVTAATSPNHYDEDENWSTGGVPSAADDVFIGNSDVSILYGLDASSVALTSFTVQQDFTGTIGLPRVTSGGYSEYRETDASGNVGYLQIQSTDVRIGAGNGTGSGRIKINTGSTAAATIKVQNTGASIESALPALQLLSAHASSTLRITDGDVGVAVGPGETSTINNLNVAGGRLICGLGVSNTGTIGLNEGDVTFGQIPTGSVSQFGGSVVVRSSSTALCTAWLLWGGTFQYNGKASGGTEVTTLQLGGTSTAALFDLAANPNTSLAVSNLRMTNNATLNDPRRILTGGSSISIRDGVRQVVTI